MASSVLWSLTGKVSCRVMKWLSGSRDFCWTSIFVPHINLFLQLDIVPGNLSNVSILVPLNIWISESMKGKNKLLKSTFFKNLSYLVSYKCKFNKRNYFHENRVYQLHVQWLDDFLIALRKKSTNVFYIQHMTY